MVLWCRHNWELADKTFVPSGIELMQKAGVTKLDGPVGDLSITRVVISWRCTKCGKLRIDKTSNRWIES